MRKTVFVATICLAAIRLTAQRQAAVPSTPAEWLTDGADAARTGWQRQESRLSPASAREIRLLWTRQLDTRPRQMHALLPPLVIGSVQTTTGAAEIVVIAGVSDDLFAVDAANGTLRWSRHFESTFTPPPGGRGAGTLCPGGQTATPVVAPGETPGQYVVYASSWDGRLRTLDAATGTDLRPPAPFVPPNSKPYALNLSAGVIYTTTAQGCGERRNAVYAIDVTTRSVTTFVPTSGGMWGRRGVSIGSDGTIFTGTGDAPLDPARGNFGQSIVALSPTRAGALAVKDFYAPENAAWMTRLDLDMNDTGPVFGFRGRELIAQSSKECRLWLLDTAALGGTDHRTPLDRTPLLCNESAASESAGVWGALSTWEDADGRRWIIAPFWGPKASAFTAPIEHGPVRYGGLAAFTVEASAGALRLAPQWISRDMNRAEPPVVANGVVFAYGSGESTTQRWSDPRHPSGTGGRIAESTHAVLFALDAATGDELWSSGDQIRSWNHASGIAVANGRVYVGTYDGTLYAFGLEPTR